jgi:hypothetical protein
VLAACASKGFGRLARGRSYRGDSCWVNSSFVCNLVPEQYRCSWLVTTSTYTGAPAPFPEPGTQEAIAYTDGASVGSRGPGGSITNSAEVIAAEVIQANELSTPLVWIEHWPQETTDVEETFELVAFSSYEVVERAPYLGETRAWIGDATWKRLDRTSVVILVGGEVW